MSGTGSETLTAALRRLADEHASGLLSVATPGRDVVLELADGVPVGIGPTHDVSDRVGRDAGPGLVAAAVVDDLVDRTVAAIVDGAGDWSWDVSSEADMMPVPDGLATELSRRAVDAAQAMSRLDDDLVLQTGRDLETHGEIARVRALFDGERSIEDVAKAAGLTLPATSVLAAALVRAGVLSTGLEDPTPTSWTDTVAGTLDEDDEDDEPELWVMDEADDEELDDHTEDAAVDVDDEHTTPAEPASPPSTPATSPQPAARARGTDTSDTADTSDGTGREIPEAMEWVVGDEADAATRAPTAASDDGWDDTTWLDELDERPVEERADDEPPVVEASSSGEQSGDARAALSSMISELQGGGEVEQRDTPPPAPTPEEDEAEDQPRATSADALRKEPKAEPGQVAEFLRELSRLALDDD